MLPAFLVLCSITQYLKFLFNNQIFPNEGGEVA